MKEIAKIAAGEDAGCPKAGSIIQIGHLNGPGMRGERSVQGGAFNVKIYFDRKTIRLGNREKVIYVPLYTTRCN